MPTARIVTRHYDEALPVVERLQQQGYTVEIFDPGQLRLSVADLEINLEVVPLQKALRLAEKRARVADADVYVERGVFARPEPQASRPMHNAPPIASSASSPEESEVETERIGDVVEKTLVDLGSAVSGAREEIAESVEFARRRAHDVAGRIHNKIEARRAQQHAARDERQRRRQEELELQRQEREREAARQTAAIAARRMAEEEERRRTIAAHRQAEAQRAAAEAARAQREREAAQRIAQETISAQPATPVFTPPPHVIAEPDPVAAEVAARMHRTVRPVVTARRPAPRLRRRSVASRRDRQWQRAALYASAAALVLMLGFAFALRQAPPSGAAQIVPQSGVQEQVPFGAATAAPATHVSPPAAKPATLPQQDASRPASKPSAAHVAPLRRHSRTGSGDVAEDTVIVHHYGTQRARLKSHTSATAGIRKFSDIE